MGVRRNNIVVWPLFVSITPQLQSRALTLLTIVCLDHFTCGSDSPQCVASQQRCNGVVDCINGWDERNDTCGNRAPTGTKAYKAQ